jgi:hypothetical protein
MRVAFAPGFMPSLQPYHVEAGAAPPVVSLNKHIERVPALANALASLLSRKPVSAPKILAARHWLKMLWVRAGAALTKMVDLQSLGNWSDAYLVSYAMGEPQLLSFRVVDSCVPSIVDGAVPSPAGAVVKRIGVCNEPGSGSVRHLDPIRCNYG